MEAEFDDVRRVAAERWPDAFSEAGADCFTLDAGAFRADFFRVPGAPDGEVCVRAKVLDLDAVARPGDFAKAVLAGNFFWGGTRGATLSVGVDGALWLTERRGAAALADAAGLEECLTDFALTVNDWRERSRLYA